MKNVFELAKAEGFSSNIDDQRAEWYLMLAELQKWLRDRKGVVVLVEHGRLKDDSFGYFTRIFPNTPFSMQYKHFEYRATYEEALEEGLKMALKNLP